MAQDKLYADPLRDLAAFQFDDKVAGVFADMIRRSVPGYGLTLDLLGVIAREYVQPHSNCYDLGCSLGASTLAIRHNLAHNSCRIIAVDNSSAMLERCQEIIDSDDADTPVELRCEDILATEINNASLVVMNFTLQFIPVEQRKSLLTRIHKGLNESGILVLSEKVAFNDAKEQALLADLHHGFKRLQGYSDLEVSQKRTALETVLIPETLGTHRARLFDSGFSEVTTWLQCFNFVSLLARK
jgi:tRNA (cmo5U34)-methyltransferase